MLKSLFGLVDRLIVQDGIRVILGPYGSAQGFAAAPIVEKYGALMVGLLGPNGSG